MATEPSAAQRIAAAIDRAEMKAKLALEYMGSFEETFTWDQWIDDDEFRVGTDIKHFILANDPDGLLRRCAADRRVLERHQPVVETVEWWDCSDSTGMATVCACCGNRESNEWDLGVGNYSAKPEGWVSPYVLWPCDDIRDLADRWAVAIGDQT